MRNVLLKAMLLLPIADRTAFLGWCADHALEISRALRRKD